MCGVVWCVGNICAFICMPRGVWVMCYDCPQRWLYEASVNQKCGTFSCIFASFSTEISRRDVNDNTRFSWGLWPGNCARQHTQALGEGKDWKAQAKTIRAARTWPRNEAKPERDPWQCTFMPVRYQLSPAARAASRRCCKSLADNGIGTSVATRIVVGVVIRAAQTVIRVQMRPVVASTWRSHTANQRYSRLMWPIRLLTHPCILL